MYRLPKMPLQYLAGLGCSQNVCAHTFVLEKKKIEEKKTIEGKTKQHRKRAAHIILNTFVKFLIKIHRHTYMAEHRFRKREITTKKDKKKKKNDDRIQVTAKQDELAMHDNCSRTHTIFFITNQVQKVTGECRGNARARSLSHTRSVSHNCTYNLFRHLSICFAKLLPINMIHLPMLIGIRHLRHFSSISF